MQVYSNTPETINLIIEVFVEVAHKQICYLGEVSHKDNNFLATITLKKPQNNNLLGQLVADWI